MESMEIREGKKNHEVPMIEEKKIRNKKQIRKLLYDKFIRPMQAKRTNYVGVEFEFPILNLRKEAVNFALCHKLAEAFAVHFHMDTIHRDRENHIYLASNPLTGDSLSFDCSYNTLELSFGPESDIHVLEGRFHDYYNFIQNFLSMEQHTLTGMGVNPYHDFNHSQPVPVGRYEMLYHYLKSAGKYGAKDYHDFPDYGMYSCASQVQLDVSEDTVCTVLNAFNRLEPFKAVLMANSLFSSRPDHLLNRDYFWKKSSHGINPKNVHMFTEDFHNVEELLSYYENVSLFCTEREGHYLSFAPLPLSQYFMQEKIKGDYEENGQCRNLYFQPQPQDIAYLRTYHLESLTFRGTVEFRSVCMQPVAELWASPALHAGLIRKAGELQNLILHSPYGKENPIKLREKWSRKNWQDQEDTEILSGFLMEILDLAKAGLEERGYGEEGYLHPLYKRAQSLLSPATELELLLKKGESMEDCILAYR